MKGAPQRDSWLVSRHFDLVWFIAPAYLSLFIVLPVLIGTWEVSEVGPYAWLLLVVFVDVAHVWTTLFRTYLDTQERRRRPALYWGLPVGVFVVGYLVHSANASWFWTGLAYVAVHHFIKQQYGFVSLYRVSAGQRSSWSRRLDKLAVYTGAGIPVVFWHSRLPRDFQWFVEGDFIFHVPGSWMPGFWLIYGVVAGVWITRRVWERTRDTPAVSQWGRDLTMLGTWLTWFVGIVVTELDFVFTATNVLIHGIPYAALVWLTARRPSASPDDVSKRYSWWTVAAVAVGLALIEEWCWDLSVWHEHSTWFGSLPEEWLAPWVVDLAVPLLMVPQGTHYLLDGYIWKLDGSNPGLRSRLFRT